MYFISILCVCLAAVTLTLGNQSQDGVQSNGDASYEFGYDIHNPLSNDIKSHHEVRDGKNVLGFYTFKEADGTIRIVKYKVTPDSGFEAVVEKLQPDQINGNAIDGQEAAPSTHGVPQRINEPNAGHNSQYVAGIARSHGITPPRNAQEPQRAHTQYYANRNPPAQHQRQRQAQAHAENPYIIRRNPHQQSQNVQNGQSRNQGYAQESRYATFPERRQKPHNHKQLTLQERGQPHLRQGNHKNRFVHGQTQQYANNPVQPQPYGSGKIVYIDGVAYIDDIGLYSDPQNDGQVLAPGQQAQYEVVENPENVNNEAATAQKGEEAETDEDKEEYEEEDDEEDEDHANYEEDDEEDEDGDASEFYEDNDHLVIEQKEQYDRLKKAYEEDGLEPKPKEQEQEQEQEQEEVQEQQPEPVQGQ